MQNKHLSYTWNTHNKHFIIASQGIFPSTTYGFSYVYACWMISGGWTTGVWILMEKKAFRCNFAKIRKIPKNMETYYLTRRRRKPEGGMEMGLMGPTPP